MLPNNSDPKRFGRTQWVNHSDKVRAFHERLRKPTRPKTATEELLERVNQLLAKLEKPE